MPHSEPIWTKADLANPHLVADKARRVRAMFAAIAPRYDLNNRIHSLGLDQAWRRSAVRAAQVQPGEVVLDVACGTGDLTRAFASRTAAGRVVGMDFTYEMLEIAHAKPAPSGATNLSYQAGDAMRLPAADLTADVVSIAFGLRNVTDPAVAVREFYRVLRPGGRLIILEFGLPKNPVLRGVYNLYFRHILPRSAAWVAGDRHGAYRYLPESVNTFADRTQVMRVMADAGFDRISAKPLSMGIAVIYRGTRPDDPPKSHRVTM